MNARIVVAGLVAAGALMGVTAGCGGTAPAPTHTVRMDVGGVVRWSGDLTTSLPGVTVTLTDIDGDTETAVTNSQGLWAIDNVDPGAYIETYELAGYETVTDTFFLEAVGENDVKNIFVSRGTIGLDETHLRAMVAPYGVELRDNDSFRDGFGGVSAVYTTGQTVVVTLSRRVLAASAVVFLRDDISGDFAFGNLDTTETQFTIDPADMAAMDGDLGPTTDTDPFTWTLELVVSVDSYSPIHGSFENLDASIEMNATP